MRPLRQLLAWIVTACVAVMALPPAARAAEDPPRCEIPMLTVGAAAPEVIVELYFDPSAPRAATIPRAVRALVASRSSWLSVRLKPMLPPRPIALSRELLAQTLVVAAARGKVEVALQWRDWRSMSELTAIAQTPSLRPQVAKELGIEAGLLEPGGAPMRCARELLTANTQALHLASVAAPSPPDPARRVLPMAVVRGPHGVATTTSVDAQLTLLDEIVETTRQQLRDANRLPTLRHQGIGSTRDAARIDAAPPQLHLQSPQARHHMEVVLTGERSDADIQRMQFALRVRAQALGEVSVSVHAWGTDAGATALRTRSCQATDADRVLDYARYLATPTVERADPRYRALLEDLDQRVVDPSRCPSRHDGVSPPPGLRINGVIIAPGDMETARDALKRSLAVGYLIPLP